jgi:hypothetical protein
MKPPPLFSLITFVRSFLRQHFLTPIQSREYVNQQELDCRMIFSEGTLTAISPFSMQYPCTVSAHLSQNVINAGYLCKILELA